MFMQKQLTLVFKIYRAASFKLREFYSKRITACKLYLNNVQYSSFTSKGIPYVSVARGGKCEIGGNFKMNNGLQGNPIGRPQPCTFVVDNGARLLIGNNVGMSSTAIVAHRSVVIGDNVKIGGGTCIYDTDFHSLHAEERANKEQDRSNKKSAEVVIHPNVFIGAHSTILKGVTIGENSIIGACSVVSKSIPANEIWAGNPAKFIKTIPR